MYDLFSYPHEPGHKGTNTSKQAAEAAKPRQNILQARVLAALQAGAFTADEVAQQLEESVLAIRPRFSELKRLQKIIDTGERRKNDSGRNGIVWRLA